METDTRNIQQRLLAVAAAVTHVEKNGTVNMGNKSYDYQRHEDVTAAAKPALIANGVLVQSTYKTSPEGMMFILVEFTNVDDPREFVAFTVPAAASNDPKQLGSQLSYAVKFAMLKVLMLPDDTPDVEEADAIRQNQTVTKKPAKPSELKDLIDRYRKALDAQDPKQKFFEATDQQVLSIARVELKGKQSTVANLRALVESTEAAINESR